MRMSNEPQHSAADPTAQVIELSELHGAPAPSKPVFAGNMDLVRNVKVRLTACVGHREITIDELFALSEGDVLELDCATNDPVELYLGERLVGRGELVVVGEHFGVRLLELGAGLGT